MKPEKSLQSDAKELVLGPTENYTYETYIFEPSPHETSLGHLFATGEIIDAQGEGQELLDKIIGAIQKEYYRDPSRSAVSSFESALHQANLILHETDQSGQREWMGCFNVAVAVLEKFNLHISVAGDAAVLIARNLQVNNISVELAHTPISDPLNTFSQVASGNVLPGDTFWLGTSKLTELYTFDELSPLSRNNSATKIAKKMHRLYRDKELLLPLASIIVSINPHYVLNKKPAQNENEYSAKRETASISPEQIKPRQPLEIKKSNLKNLVLATAGLTAKSWHKTWSVVKTGSRKGGQTIMNVSRRKNQDTDTAIDDKSSSVVKKLPSRLGLSRARSWPQAIWGKIVNSIRSMPRTSKVFGLLTIILTIALITSLYFLQSKRTEDEAIQKASEILHQATTKKEAADMALIYNNREQANSLLSDAEELLEQLAESDLYVEERESLTAEIRQHYDRLHKVSRVSAENSRIIGNFNSVITQRPPSHLFMAGENLYTFNPENNAIVMMDIEGSVQNVSSNTQGIGFFSTGTSHQADKTLILASQDGNIAIFDANDETLRKQEVQLPSNETNIKSVAIFGNRLYIYDATAGNIFSMNKTLRGFSNSMPWITDDSFAKDNITSLAVDGNIFTLHEDGAIARLFRGQPAEFNLESIEPGFDNALRLITTDNMRHLYVVDPYNSRVVILNKTGALVRQVYVESSSPISDIAIGPQERNIYVLTGTEVLEVSLEE